MVAIRVTAQWTDRWAPQHLCRSFCEAESSPSASLCSALLHVAVIEKPTSMEDTGPTLRRRTESTRSSTDSSRHKDDID
ncbi:hypothetical protein MUK42_07598 [Musa troglodytarum]|uniref:Uncharacterized protein n=1 Tax=Musa troglodytarum TaxID=320322 RepID=A0A9E7GDE1_9LILI|nr:hypothetical protein MUK42_07598 [Musa troglodytarum]